MTDRALDSTTGAPLDQGEAADLMRRAEDARGNAYAPYSGFPVGAALLDAAGRVHIGANVENASFGLTICAERAALFSAVASGARTFRAIAIAGPEEGIPCYPCGACRQVLHEFGSVLPIIVAAPADDIRIVSLDDLLPEAFGPARLGSVQSHDNDRPDPFPIPGSGT